jgi:periplasmic nitrate reductase NapE
MTTQLSDPTNAQRPATRAEELRSVLFLSIVMAPVLAVMLVGGYGFLIWMVQLVTGPPGS